LTALAALARAQAIEFETNGTKYQTLTRSGLTIIVSMIQPGLHSYDILQVSVANGSKAPYVIRPEDFSFVRASGPAVRASGANSVVQELVQGSTKADVLRLVQGYEASLYGIPHMRSTNGYEQRRQAALLFGSGRLRAAAAASAVALVQTRLAPGESTDGAVFLPTGGKPLGPGRVVVRTTTDSFEFNPLAASQPQPSR
jgi:hypothetical protein